jgi:hypothetical protein
MAPFWMDLTIYVSTTEGNNLQPDLYRNSTEYRFHIVQLASHLPTCLSRRNQLAKRNPDTHPKPTDHQ